MQFPDDLLHGQLVPRVGGADEIIVGDLQFLPNPLKHRDNAVGQLLGLDLLLLGGLDHLDAVLVGAGEEKRVVAGQAVIAGNRVSAEGGVDVAEMRLGVGVVDGGGDVKLFCHLLS